MYPNNSKTMGVLVVGWSVGGGGCMVVALVVLEEMCDRFCVCNVASGTSYSVSVRSLAGMLGAV